MNICCSLSRNKKKQQKIRLFFVTCVRGGLLEWRGRLHEQPDDKVSFCCCFFFFLQPNWLKRRKDDADLASSVLMYRSKYVSQLLRWRRGGRVSLLTLFSFPFYSLYCLCFPFFVSFFSSYIF